MKTGNEEKYLKFYNSQRNKIEEKLLTSLKGKKPESLYEPGKYILSGGGKRIRPVMLLFSALAAGGKASRAYNAAVAIELLHNFTLVHDDIMDNADKRRGRLTLHRKYDVNTAIIVGDGLLAVAYEFLLKDCRDNTKVILQNFNKGLREVCEGQSMDNDFERIDDVTLNEYFKMIKKKTAALFEVCCSIGSVLGGASSEHVKRFAKYGMNIGIAFQIQDDLLDITAEESKFGKIIGGDLVEGKKTFLLLSALFKAKGAYKKDLMEVIKDKGAAKNKIAHIKNIYEELGVISDAENQIKKYSNLAMKSLGFLKTTDHHYYDMFYWLTNFLIKRNI